MQPRWITAEEFDRLVPPGRARELLRDALRDGFDPAADPARSFTDTAHGQLLLMPSHTSELAGVKVLGIAPGNTGRGLPTIQGLYVLMDAATLTPHTLIDGTAITGIRTAAVSAVALEVMAPDTVGEAVIFGTGPQARSHAAALLELRAVDRISLVGRDLGRAADCAEDVGRLGAPCRVITPEDAEDAVRQAQVIICATSSPTPVLESDWVADGAAVVAVGSHSPDRRELDGELLRRSLVVVEDIETALREAGDVVLAIDESALRREDLITMASLARGDVARPTDRPSVFKSVGMSWQDLVVAGGVG